MPPAPPTLSQRLSDGGARFGRSVSTMLRRVSSLGSEGWNENELAFEDGDVRDMRASGASVQASGASVRALSPPSERAEQGLPRSPPVSA
jgi:hypothetical protein